MTPLDAFNIIMYLEGGDKVVTDSGGLTKWGISQKAYPDVDVANLTKEEAFGYFKKDYWDAVNAKFLPSPLNLLVVDAAFNQGPKTATRLLQKALETVPVDGIMGKRTISAANHTAIAELCAKFMARRHLSYIGTRNFKKYGEGWFNRLGRLMMELTKWQTVH